MSASRAGSMYVTGYKSLSTNEAMKSAESLLEQKTITEIKEIESKTRADIEAKKKQLRQLVGNSYRELIASADTIVQMAEVCRNVVSNITTIQDSFSGLVQDIAAAKGNKFQKAESLRHEELYAVGSRVKYLVDTPEMIWGCLDSCAFLEGAHRFLRASEVHRLLVSGASKQVMHQFPLLRHQWPLVQKFRESIQERAQQSLRTEATLSSEKTADALAAVAFLSELDSAQSLSLYLDCRRSWIVGHLKSGAADGASRGVEAVSEVMCSIAAVVQDTIAQAGDLFLVPYMESGVPLLVAKAADDGMSSSELLFGALPNKGDEQPLSEVAAWEHCIKSIRQRLSPMSTAEVSAVCSEWITGIAKNHGEDILNLLRSCRSAVDLAAVEHNLRASLGKWRKGAQEGDKSSRLLSSHVSLAPHASLGGGVDGVAGASRADGWQDVCDWVLQRRCSLWKEVFDEAYLDCVKSHVRRWFDDIADGLEGPLDECLKIIGSSDAALVGAYRPAYWPDTAPSLKHLHAGASSAAGPVSPSGTVVLGWRARLDGIITQFDSQLCQLLNGVIQVLEDVSEVGEEGEGGGLHKHKHKRKNSSSSRRTVSGRANALEPYVQDRCGHLAQLIAERMQSRLSAIPEPVQGAAGAPAVEASLCIARLCSSIASGSMYLKVILGSPEDWRDPKLLSMNNGALGTAFDQRTSSGGGVFKVRSQHTRLEALQQRLKSVAMVGYLAWARWAAQGLAEGLVRGVTGDAVLSLNTPLRSWEETVVKQEGDSESEGAVEMRFPLPATASASVVSFMMATCSELQRAGGHAMDSSVLSMAEAEVAESALSALSTALQPDSQVSSRLSEKGMLQLLFDLRLMRDVLSGGKKYTPHAPGQPNGNSHGNSLAPQHSLGPRYDSLSAKHHGWYDLEMLLAERLDPIDWATYEPFLWANEARYCQRCSVLFGSLMQLNKMHNTNVPRVAASSDTNLLTIAPPCARFSYLPISTPSMLYSHQHSAVAASTGSVADQLDMTGDYSFANIGGQRLASEAVGSAAESATATAFEALQSRFSSQRFGALGSLLGDKAAEVTAMAQQSLGEMALPGGFTTGSGFFSTLGKTFRTS